MGFARRPWACGDARKAKNEESGQCSTPKTFSLHHMRLLAALLALAACSAAAQTVGDAKPTTSEAVVDDNPFRAAGATTESAAAKFAADNLAAPSAPAPLAPAEAALALSRVGQVTLVRHGEHAHLGSGPSIPCLSEVGVARASVLVDWIRKPPRGLVGRVDAVSAMNGTGGDPPSVRPIDSAIPSVLAWRIPEAHFDRRWGQWDSLAAARAILDLGAQAPPLGHTASGRGHAGASAVLVVWFHWGLVAILNALGVPTTGWNAQSLDGKTTEAYNAAVVLTPHGSPRLGEDGAVLPDPDPRAGIRVRLYRTPPIDHSSLLPPEADPGKETVFFDEVVPWAVVARQAGHVVRVVPVNETTGRGVGGSPPVVVEVAEPKNQL